jgi:hypothetical protein
MDTPTAAASYTIRKRAVMPPPSSAPPSSAPKSSEERRHSPNEDLVQEEDDSHDVDGSGTLRFLYSRYVLLLLLVGVRDGCRPIDQSCLGTSVRVVVLQVRACSVEGACVRRGKDHSICIYLSKLLYKVCLDK